jgi:hypothetical protein
MAQIRCDLVNCNGPIILEVVLSGLQCHAKLQDVDQNCSLSSKGSFGHEALRSLAAQLWSLYSGNNTF